MSAPSDEKIFSFPERKRDAGSKLAIRGDLFNFCIFPIFYVTHARARVHTQTHNDGLDTRTSEISIPLFRLDNSSPLSYFEGR